MSRDLFAAAARGHGEPLLLVPAEVINSVDSADLNRPFLNSGQLDSDAIVHVSWHVHVAASSRLFAEHGVPSICEETELKGSSTTVIVTRASAFLCQLSTSPLDSDNAYSCAYV